MNRVKAQKTARQKFAEALSGHLTNGTQPGKAIGEPWTYEAFASEIITSQQISDTRAVSPRSVSNWCNGRSLPREISPILIALFGHEAHPARSDLDRLFRRAKQEQRLNYAPILEAKPDLAGGRWKAQDDHLVIVRPQTSGDKRAARDPQQQQLQAHIANLAGKLSDESRRLNNSRIWSGISDLARNFEEALSFGSREMEGNLANIYITMLRLGGYLDTDLRIRSEGRELEDALPPGVHGTLRDLIRAAAPWIRAFPTIAGWDEASGRFLTNVNELLRPAREFVRVANQENAITSRDAEDVEAMVVTAEEPGFFASKASAHALGYAKNLVIETAKALAADDLGDVPDTVLIERLDAVVRNPAARIGDLVSAFPDELRDAIEQTIRTRQFGGSSVDAFRQSDGATRELGDSQASREGLLYAALGSINDAVIVFSADGRLRLHNEAFQRFWNIAPEQLARVQDFGDIAKLCTPRLNDLSFWRDLEAQISDPSARAALSGEVKDSDSRVVGYRSQPLPDGATLFAFTDLTDARKLASALADRSAALAETERLKRDFVGNVSYELRTPLTTIIGYSELLERSGENLSERGRSHAAAVRSAATQLARSIDDVLDMAQIDADEMALDLEDVDVAELLNEAAARRAEEAAAAQVTVKVEYSDDVGLIRGDVRRLAQTLDHLTENAIRQTPPEGVVTISARRALGEVQLSVSDTGLGIPMHVQAHIFDRFIGRERGGPGLGLALVKSLVELHGGWVALESEPGAGAIFTCHLPEDAWAAVAPSATLE